LQPTRSKRADALTQLFTLKGRKTLVRFFDDIANGAETGRKSAVRALQAWQYLIGKSVNRQIVKYEELRTLMGYPTSNPLASILGCIMFYCEQNNLPPLTIIVVNRHGVPGEGFTAEELEDYHRRREDVFNYDWFKIVPPTIDEFQEARENA
jgi:hypothetical protein